MLFCFPCTISVEVTLEKSSNSRQYLLVLYAASLTKISLRPRVNISHSAFRLDHESISSNYRLSWSRCFVWIFGNSFPIDLSFMPLRLLYIVRFGCKTLTGLFFRKGTSFSWIVVHVILANLMVGIDSTDLSHHLGGR